MKKSHLLLSIIGLVLCATIAYAQRDATYVIGANDLTSFGDISLPEAVHVSPATGKIFVSTRGALYRFPSNSYYFFGSQEEIIFVGGLETPSNGAFNYLIGLNIDKTDTLYGTDSLLNRVFKVDSISTITTFLNFSWVLGQPDFYTNAPGPGIAQLNVPVDAIYDPRTDCIWVADSQNHRVNKYGNASHIVTGIGYTTYFGNGTMANPSSVGTPNSVTVDCRGNLYVGDSTNRRILRFDNAHLLNSESPASLVLGQLDFYSSSVPDPRSFDPYYIYWFDDVLYVSDSLNHRVVIFDQVSKTTNGQYPNELLGQPNFFITTSRPISASTLYYPRGIYVSKALIYVVSFGEARAVVYTQPEICPPVCQPNQNLCSPCKSHHPYNYNQYQEFPQMSSPPLSTGTVLNEKQNHSSQVKSGSKGLPLPEKRKK